MTRTDEGTRAGVAGRASSQVAINTLLLFVGLLLSLWYAGQLLQEIQTTLTATAMGAARGANANAGGDDSRLPQDHRRLPIPLHELTADDPNLVCPEPLVAVHDRIVSGTANTSTATNNQTKPRRIPRIMHLSMRSRCMPPDLADTVFRWQKALPNHDIYFHDDAAIERLMRDDPWPEFPHLLKIYDGCIQVKGAVMVDIWRILVLYRYGGLYSDIDNWPLQPFTEDEPIQQGDSAMFFSDPFNRPSQWFMSMEPKHPIAYFSMFEILKRILAVETIEDFKPVFTTGPDPCKIGYAVFLEGNGEKYEEIFGLGVHVAAERFGNRTVRKLGREGGEYLRKHLGDTFDDMVDNTDKDGKSFKITRKERSERQSGALHWKKMVTNRRVEVEKPGGRCLDLLYKLDQDTTRRM